MSKYTAGQVIGCNEVLEYIGGSGGMYLCRCCRCGNIRTVHGMGVNSNYCNKCFDYSSEGLRGRDHYLYWIYYSIQARCYDKKCSDYPKYGGRGIKLSDEWLNGVSGKTGFQCFVEEIHTVLGLRPDMNTSRTGDRKLEFKRNSYHLGRKDHDKNYSIENVQWESNSDNSLEASNRKGKYLLGVSYDVRSSKPKPYRAKIAVGSQHVAIGSFATELQAHEAYCAAYFIAHDKPCPHKAFVAEAPQYYSTDRFNEGDSLQSSCVPLA